MTARSLTVLPVRLFDAEDLRYYRERLGDSVTLLEPASYNESELLSAAAAADVLLGEPSAALLQAARNAKLIQVPWTGVERIDKDAVLQSGIPLCNSHSNAAVVAEHALALLLDAYKRITSHDRAMRVGDWRRPGSDRFDPPRRLAGSTVVIFGFGAIGRALGKLLVALGVHVIGVVRNLSASDRSLDSEFAIVDHFEDAIRAADAVVLCAPLTDTTRGIINRDRLALMKEDSVIVNVSRGALVDEEALWQALHTRQIAWAALDTWLGVPRAGATRMASVQVAFEELENVTLSPHRSGFEHQTHPHLDDAIENIRRLANGEPLINRVDLLRGY